MHSKYAVNALSCSFSSALALPAVTLYPLSALFVWLRLHCVEYLLVALQRSIAPAPGSAWTLADSAGRASHRMQFV